MTLQPPIVLAFTGPIYGPDHPKGPTIGPQCEALKRVLKRWDPDTMPSNMDDFDQVWNRRAVGAMQVAQRTWNLTPTGNVGKTTFNRLLKAMRGRGLYKPAESAWDEYSVKLYKASTPRVPPAQCFPFPSPNVVKVISDRRGHMSRPLGNWQSDNANDFWAKPGTPVLSPKPGVVIRVGGVDPHHGPVGTIFGEHVTIECPDGDRFFFTHIDRLVSVGEELLCGELIGRVGDWPRSSAMDHAHVGRIWGKNPDDIRNWPQISVYRGLD